MLKPLKKTSTVGASLISSESVQLQQSGPGGSGLCVTCTYSCYWKLLRATYNYVCITCVDVAICQS